MVLRQGPRGALFDMSEVPLYRAADAVDAILAAEVDSGCRLLLVPLFRSSSRFKFITPF